MDWLAFISALIVTLFIGAVAIMVLWAILTARIDLVQLISDDNGKASLSRFQFLIFTVVIAMSFLIVTLQKQSFPAVPPQVLWLFAISAASYVIARGIQAGGGKR